MKKLLFVLSLFAILFTQCKKSEQIVPVIPESKTVNITLDVSGNSKVDVWPQHGAVAFESGDVIYVASAGKYVGTLTHNGTKFEGSITGATEGQKLYFYFMGNKTPSETLNESTTSLTVNISDQTTEYPVISSAPSNQNFSLETSDYSAFLLNKCALVKFDVTTLSTSYICIKKMNNLVSVNLSSNSYTNSKVDGGVIKMAAGNGEHWAILLPQDEVTGDTEGDAYSADGIFTGTYETVPSIENNSYVTDGINITLTAGHEYVDLGLPSGLLWATCNIGANSPEERGNLYAWGEVTTKSIYEWSNYKWYWQYYYCMTKYALDDNGLVIDNKTELEPEDDAAVINWGNGWRMPTKTEIDELVNECLWSYDEGNYAYWVVGPNGNRIYLKSFFVFDTFWSSSLWSTSTEAYILSFSDNFVSVSGSERYKGRCIRPVHQPQN